MINNFTGTFIQSEDQNNKDDSESICNFSPLTLILIGAGWAKNKELVTHVCAIKIL